MNEREKKWMNMMDDKMERECKDQEKRYKEIVSIDLSFSFFIWFLILFQFFLCLSLCLCYSFFKKKYLFI